MRELLVTLMFISKYGLRIVWSCFATTSFQDQQLMDAMPLECSTVQPVLVKVTHNAASLTNGSYDVYPKNSCVGTTRPCTKSVYCDFQTDGGGWTIIQKRTSAAESFTRSWQEYKVGFGNPDSSYWIGNDYLAEVTNNGTYEMLIKLQPFNQTQEVTSKYSSFQVGKETSAYRLTFTPAAGNTDPNLNPSQGMPFGTFDRDTDSSTQLVCGAYYMSGWWHESQCGRTGDLNVPYDNPDPRLPHLKGIEWTVNGKAERMRTTLMMIRPANFGQVRVGRSSHFGYLDADWLDGFNEVDSDEDDDDDDDNDETTDGSPVILGDEKHNIQNDINDNSHIAYRENANDDVIAVKFHSKHTKTVPNGGT